MKFKLGFFVALLLLISARGNEILAGTPTAPATTDNYFPVKEYTLKNGLKVFISVNKNAPRIQTAITVKAGSKYDPPQTTGLAHYLEHMLFKGTKDFGTANYAKEKPYLDAISDLFEKRMHESNEAKKKEIYKKIDSLSYEASKFAIPNEYDKLVASLGAKNTNAFTDRDLTCYVNDIPSNGLEKWLAIEANRFQDLELRIFHTELEAVYEEFNRNTAEDGEWSSQAVDSLLMPNHPYGSQTTIGLSEHLKNPSMVNIHKYFDKYYVPSNCAIVMSGDLDPDKTVAMIEKYFGNWKNKPVEPFVKAPPVPIKAAMYTEKKGQQPEHVILGFRFDGASSKDYMYVKLIDAILANGKGSGLMDLNLKLKQQVLEAVSQYQDNKDYTIHKLYGEPKEGQKLEEVKTLLLQQIDSVKQGRFADWLLPAIIDNMKLDMMKQAETNQGRVFDVVFAYVKDIPLEKKRNEISELSKITKADIIKFANERYGNNYAVCYKRMGEPSLFKVDKPQITPVVLNKDSVSAFRRGIDAMPFAKLAPKFADFANDIKHSKMAKGITVDYIHNDMNKTFAMNYIFDMGTDNDKKLGLAFDYLPYLGTQKYDAAQLKQEFYKLGLSFSVNSSRDQVYVTLSGLEENLDAGIKLFEYMLGNVKADQAVYDELVQDEIKKRADAKLNKDNILFNALVSYGKYGSKNPFNDVLSNEELKKIKADDLVAIIKSLHSYKHKIFYFGDKNLASVTASLDRLHDVPATLKDYPTATKYPELTTETQVYYATYPMKQAEMIMFAWDNVYDKNQVPGLSMFNEYYGGNMSSVLFQEIREKQALAYSVYGQYGVPTKKDEKFSVLAYVGTQADKMNTAATEVSKLLNDLPESQRNFDLSRDAVMKGIETDWITNAGIYWAYQRAEKRGLDYDIRKDIYSKAQTMKLNDVHQFFNQHIKGKKYVYLVLGGKEDLDMKSLAKLGPVKELTLEQLFGY
ncbi:MAG: protease3 [Bacteroidetes bacterium]|nr:protease3 [Bacteroidota bacterium]